MDIREHYNELRSEMLSIMNQDVKYKSLWKGQNTKKFNYFITEPEFMEVIINTLTDLYGSSSIKFLDLGAGVGVMFQLFPSTLNIQCTGYEIEPNLIELNQMIPSIVNNPISHPILLKDMITISSSDVVGFDVIYFYEPLLDQNDCNSFAVNLYNSVSDSQLVIYHNGGLNMKRPLEQYFYFQDIFLNELYILTKK